jgi:hypothetical protein
VRQREGRVIGRQRKHGGFYRARIQRRPSVASTGFGSGIECSSGGFSNGEGERIERGNGGALRGRVPRGLRKRREWGRFFARRFPEKKREQLGEEEYDMWPWVARERGRAAG